MSLKEKLNKIVHSAPIANTIGVASINTPILLVLETRVAGISYNDSAEMRMIAFLTDPIFGFIRDYIKNKFNFENEKDVRRKSELIDIAIGAGIGICEVGISISKYCLLKKMNGGQIDYSDVMAGIINGVYTAAAGDLLGANMDTMKDGLLSKREKGNRSLFSEKISQKNKRNICYAVGAGTIALVGTYFGVTR